MATPRVLCIIGSGETAPTMSAVHEDLLRRAGAPPAPAVLLDTPFGFQENADELVARAQAYFRAVAHVEVTAASLRSADAASPLEVERMLAQVRGAASIFAGPGSPSYALRQWDATQLRGVLGERLREGGCVATFSSAAACTIGIVALPVYEIYKAGEPPHWLAGLDLLSAAGLRCTVIPHYDNAEGGTHDTRYCYMGERRLRVLERNLPEGAAILGVCEHTACILDLDADTVEVRGRGYVAVRRRGAEERIESGHTAPLERLRAAAALGDVVTPALGVAAADEMAAAPTGNDTHGNPLLQGMVDCRADFTTARERGDVDGMVGAVLAVEALIVEWVNDSLVSDAMDRARGELRAMVVELGRLAEAGARDPRAALAPVVELALRLRDRARSERRFGEADAIRAALGAADIELSDRPDRTDWSLSASPDAGGAPRDRVPR